ncbi:MAG: ImmA/IrrE family metallo-endopeptidase [Thermodesulfobacteriota bacterium]|nr:ImmA/IrrE family metallo-endopeptidase [Thermodesulfobacteriota bacterium]
MENLTHFECKWIPKENLWQAVSSFRKRYWPEDTLPVDMEKIVEQRLRLNIEPIHSLLDELDVDAFLKLDLSGIVVDYDCFMQERFQNRIRFSFAHEVGHYVLHKDIYEKFPFTRPEEWKNSVLNMADKEYRNFEWQANEFAGRLLVPRERLIVEVKKIYKIIEDSGIQQYLSDDPGAVLSRVSPVLCKPFGVSENVIERRVEREGLWPPKF